MLTCITCREESFAGVIITGAQFKTRKSKDCQQRMWTSSTARTLPTNIRGGGDILGSEIWIEYGFLRKNKWKERSGTAKNYSYG